MMMCFVIVVTVCVNGFFEILSWSMVHSAMRMLLMVHPDELPGMACEGKARDGGMSCAKTSRLNLPEH